jgi:hypothetical protein
VQTPYRISKIRRPGDNLDLAIAITGNPSVVCPHCKVATRFRHDHIERRQVVLMD